MKIEHLDEGVGRIVKGVNTTPDVGVGEIPKQAAKFGNKVDKDGRPPTLSSKVKGKSTNVLFNLGLTEGIKLRLERDKHIDVLHIQDTDEKHRVEIRGKKGYETNGYDPMDKLHQVLDRVGKAANISDLINGDVVHINPHHPQGARAIRTARDVLTTEDAPRYTAAEWAIMEGGHSLNDVVVQPKQPGDIFTALEEKWSQKYKRNTALKEQPWNNQYDSGSLSSKIFQPGDFVSNSHDPVWGLWMPLSSGILHRITPKKQRVTSFHLTGVQNIDNMINLQGKKKSISSFFYMYHSEYDRGIRGGGGVIFELDANLLGAFEQDVMSDPDKSGIRWITLEYLIRAAYEKGKPLMPMYEEMANLIKRLLKKYAPDVTYNTDQDAVDEWTDYGKRLKAENDGKTLNLVIKDYIDGVYAIMMEHAEHVRTALFYYMDKPGSTDDSWDEVVVNEFKIKIAHVLKNTAEDPQNLEKLKQLESKGIPVRVWNSPQELHDYVKKIGMSQKLDENFADGKKKGKSRPGRVKRSGASCNGSVTDLRKRAKKYGGERGRMYHWCANMKSGRKKS